VGIVSGAVVDDGLEGFAVGAVDAPTVCVEVELNYHLGRSKAYKLSCVAKVREWDLRAF
jgi:hypothetical protein